MVVLAKGGAAASAGIPPVGRGIDHRIPTGLGLVGLPEFLDPGHHFGRAQPVAGGARRVVLNVQHTGQSLAIVRPATAVG